MKKQLLFLVTMLTSFFFVININAQTIGSVQTNNPICYGAFSGDVTININQSNPPNAVAVKLFRKDPINGFWILTAVSYCELPSWILVHSFPSLSALEYRVDLENIATGVVIDDESFILNIQKIRKKI